MKQHCWAVSFAADDRIHVSVGACQGTGKREATTVPAAIATDLRASRALSRRCVADRGW